jgi:hypothetical protein
MGMGTKEDESSTGCVWTAGCHHVTVRSCLVHILKVMNHLFLLFSDLLIRAMVNRGYCISRYGGGTTIVFVRDKTVCSGLFFLNIILC